MKSTLRLALATFCICMMSDSAPALGQKLYPVQGPLAAQRPEPVFTGHIKRPPFAAGPPFLLLKSWTLADGEVLKKTIATVKASSLNTPEPGTAASDPPQPNLAFAWDAIYGQGYFAAQILGRNLLQGVFAGSQGTTLQVESLNGKFGVAVDNKGNLYKMVW